MLTLTLSLFLACRTEVAQTGQDITTPTKVPESQKVVVYSGRGESLVGELFSAIENSNRSSGLYCHEIDARIRI